MSILQHFGHNALIHYKLPYIEELHHFTYPAIIITSKKLAIQQSYLTKQDIPHLLAAKQSIQRLIPTPYVEHVINSEFRAGLIDYSTDDLKAQALDEAADHGFPTQTQAYGPVKFEVRYEMNLLRWSLVYCYRYKAPTNRQILCQIFNRTAKFQLFISDDTQEMELSVTAYEFETAVQKIEAYLGAQGVCVKLR